MIFIFLLLNCIGVYAGGKNGKQQQLSSESKSASPKRERKRSPGQSRKKTTDSTSPDKIVSPGRKTTFGLSYAFYGKDNKFPFISLRSHENIKLEIYYAKPETICNQSFKMFFSNKDVKQIEYSNIFYTYVEATCVTPHLYKEEKSFNAKLILHTPNCFLEVFSPNTMIKVFDISAIIEEKDIKDYFKTDLEENFLKKEIKGYDCNNSYKIDNDKNRFIAKDCHLQKIQLIRNQKYPFGFYIEEEPNHKIEKSYEEFFPEQNVSKTKK